MSQKNLERRRSARERLREERERDRARDRRKRTLTMMGVVVAVLALAAVVGVVVTRNGTEPSSTGKAIAPRGASGKNGLVIPTGKASAPVTLTVYEDFRCPGCKQFEDVFRTTVHGLQNGGRLKTEYHLVTIIDSNLGGTGSLSAANAAACAQDAGKYTAYHDVLYRNQPPETSDAYADKKTLIKLAGEVSGLDTAAFRRCVRSGKHDAWVRKSNSAFASGGFASTPTVLLDGKNIYGDRNNPLSPNKLKTLVADAAKR